MKIDLTKKQYEDLMVMTNLANSVLGILGDIVGEEYKKRSDNARSLENYFLGFAKEFGHEDFTEKYKEKLLVSEKLDSFCDEIMDEYNNETFWHELETRMGRRDFERSMTKEEKKYIEDNNGWLPERIHVLYSDYSKEFEDYGINRLEIKE